MTSRTFSAVVALLLFLCPQAGRAEDSPLDLFEQRIMPIFRSPKPSSCVQCHLSAVDLKEYILPSHEKTFVSLRDRGLIDVEHPEKSKILKLIQMGEKDQDRRSRLIHRKTRKAEYEAFAAWIKASCADSKMRNLPPLEKQPLKADKPDKVIRYNRKDRVLDSFVRNIWSQRMRCFPCHTPHEIHADNPRHEKPLVRYRELRKKYGRRIDIFRETPRETMQHLIVSSSRHSPDHLPLINTAEPRKSLLVLKPTSKLPKKIGPMKFEEPSSALPVSHMGGLKMHVNDHSYKAFVTWIRDYANVLEGRYASLEALPRDNWHPTQHVLRLRQVPESWKPFTVVQLFVHAWDPKSGKYRKEPTAFTQSLVTPRRFVNGPLILLRGKRVGAAQAKKYPAGTAAVADKDAAPHRKDSHPIRMRPGKYLIKAYLDKGGRVDKDPAALLGPDDFVGQAEVKARWRIGFRQAEVVPGQRFQSE